MLFLNIASKLHYVVFSIHCTYTTPYKQIKYLSICIVECRPKFADGGVLSVMMCNSYQTIQVLYQLCND